MNKLKKYDLVAKIELIHSSSIREVEKQALSQ